MNETLENINIQSHLSPSLSLIASPKNPNTEKVAFGIESPNMARSDYTNTRQSLKMNMNAKAKKRRSKFKGKLNNNNEDSMS